MSRADWQMKGSEQRRLNWPTPEEANCTGQDSTQAPTSRYHPSRQTRQVSPEAARSHQWQCMFEHRQPEPVWEPVWIWRPLQEMDV